MIIERNGVSFYINETLQANLDTIKKQVANDWDFVCGVDGALGSGKSTLALQMASYLDPSFNVERVCFESEDFLEQIKKAEKFQAIVLDESYRSFSSRRAMSSTSHVLNSMMLEIRQKNLYIFIVIPCVFHLDSMIALWRLSCLLHVYSDERKQRGYFAFFNEQRKKTLILMGKKFLSYRIPKANFIGTFPKAIPIDKTAYLEKKKLVLERLSFDNPSNKYAERSNEHKIAMLKVFREDFGLTYRQIADKMNRFLAKKVSEDALSQFYYREITHNDQQRNRIDLLERGEDANPD